MITLTEEMFKMNAPQPIAQGEVTIWMKKYAPKEIIKQLGKSKMTEMKLENDRLILGHSETGHHHVLEAARPDVHVSNAARALIDETNDLFIDLQISETCCVQHMRGSDTHKAFLLPPGDYICRPDDEQTIEGWRRVAD